MERTIQVTVCLYGVLNQAADAMERIGKDLREEQGYDETNDDPFRDDDDPCEELESHVSILRMIAKHAEGVEDGIHDPQGFVDLYNLKPRKDQA